MAIEVLECTTWRANPPPKREGVLYVTEDIPEFKIKGDYFKGAQIEFRKEAERVVDFLEKVMPQGLVDHIFAELAKRKASVFSVRKVED